MAIHNFSWVIQNKLAGSALPGRDAFGITDLILSDMKELYNSGIRCLISLTDMACDFSDICENAGLKWVYYPIPDFGVPDDMESYKKIIDIAIEYINNDMPVCVHCYAGIGRTGIVLSSIVSSYHSVNTEDAIQFIRKNRTAIETGSQIRFVDDFVRINNLI